MLASVLASGLLALVPGTGGSSLPSRGARRGNTVLARPSARPVYSVAAALRVPVLVGGGAGVVQPVGFGAGLHLRVHPLGLGRAPARLGLGLVLGHNRVLDRRRLELAREDGTTEIVTRYAALDQSTFFLGPSLQIVIGPVLLEAGGGVGLGIGSLVRPLPSDPNAEERLTTVAFAVRGEAHLGIPIRNNHGIIVGLALEKLFSKVRTTSDVDRVGDPAAPADVAPFDMVLAPYLGYQGWF